MTTPDAPNLKHHTFTIKGLNLHVVTSGPIDGPPLILLHGFPEFWYGWRNQIGPLAQAGYRVIVPDQRGYNLSEKPRGLKNYTQDELAADVVGLMDHLDLPRATLVAHDWGGAVAWWTALKHPDRVERLVALNIPHPLAMSRALRRPAQLCKSWYIGFFQLPWIPEAVLSRGEFAPLLELMTRSCKPGVFTQDERSLYREAYSQPGALKAMLSWYRAVVQRRLTPPRSSKVQAPTLLIWGRGDQALGWEMAQPSVDFCADGRLVFIEDAGHFVALDAPAQVNALLLDFLST